MNLSPSPTSRKSSSEDIGWEVPNQNLRHPRNLVTTADIQSQDHNAIYERVTKAASAGTITHRVALRENYAEDDAKPVFAQVNSASLILSLLFILLILTCALFLLVYISQAVMTYWFTIGTAEAVLKLLCSLSSFILFASPCSAFLTALRASDPDRMPIGVIITQLFVNALGVAYGMRTDNAAIYVINAFGLSIQGVCIFGHRYLRGKAELLSGRNIRTLVESASTCNEHESVSDRPVELEGKHKMVSGGPGSKTTASTWKMWMWLWLPFTAAWGVLMIGFSIACQFVTTDYIGLANAFSNTVLFAAPLPALEEVIATKNPNKLPITTICAMVFTSTVWSIYGFVSSDAVIYFPSIIGFELSVLQFLVYLWCRGLLPKVIDLESLIRLLLPHKGGRYEEIRTKKVVSIESPAAECSRTHSLETFGNELHQP